MEELSFVRNHDTACEPSKDCDVLDWRVVAIAGIADRFATIRFALAKRRMMERLLQIGAIFAILLTMVSWTSAQVHEHGVAEVGIAVDERSAQIEFRAPGSAIVGMERLPQSATEKQAVASGFRRFRENASKMFQFEPQLGCNLRVLQVELGDDSGHSHDADGGHAPGQSADHAHEHLDVRALTDVQCKEPLKGTALRFALSTVFPEIKIVRVQVVGLDFQTGTELRGTRDSVRLARTDRR